jgi:hypothetical protein
MNQTNNNLYSYKVDQIFTTIVSIYKFDRFENLFLADPRCLRAVSMAAGATRHGGGSPVERAGARSGDAKPWQPARPSTLLRLVL